ncbi:uncharacterized protein LOC18039383 isoform X4 [Citrus clementina]|uniref:uncharacterized protein LOC18039383 isoform X4 n=1 Tax=Citrus clementina TaxID=85681 RepID=UPI000CED358F|nr:uncharacterized protein LOC18039383 isoform X4 [Citrus x clementina]XP_024037850.1 uncharacterized protein LOC18039383 isoform X4 [Citrus x clementina]
MVVISRASKLSLPNPSLPSSPPQITSALYEPNSLSLALMHSDSSISLYSSISLFTLSSLPSTPQVLIPSPSYSFTFLLLNHTPNPNPSPRVAFIAVGPHRSEPKLVLRLYVLKRNNFYGKAQVFCKQKGVSFDEKLGVLLDINHGLGLKLVGSVNFFAMYSLSSSKIWVFGVKLMDGDGDDGVRVKLMRCAVIECCKPVWSLSLSFGFMILGEDNGVRVLNLRSLVKGKVKKIKNSSLPNGIIGDYGFDGPTERIACNGYLDEKIDKHSVSVKQRSVKYKQDSDEGGACFLAFRMKEVEGLKSTKMPLMSLKAISIQAVSLKKFLILDSSGNLHMLHLSSPVAGSNIIGHIRQLPHVMNVQKLAVHPDISLRTQTIWITDGYHSVNVMVSSDMDAADNENGRNESEENLTQCSVIEAIFVGEKIQDLVPLAANGLLILGQGNLYAYANS